MCNSWEFLFFFVSTRLISTPATQQTRKNAFSMRVLDEKLLKRTLIPQLAMKTRLSNSKQHLFREILTKSHLHICHTAQYLKRVFFPKTLFLSHFSNFDDALWRSEVHSPPKWRRRNKSQGLLLLLLLLSLVGGDKWYSHIIAGFFASNDFYWLDELFFLLLARETDFLSVPPPEKRNVL